MTIKKGLCIGYEIRYSGQDAWFYRVWRYGKIWHCAVHSFDGLQRNEFYEKRYRDCLDKIKSGEYVHKTVKLMRDWHRRLF